jgi:hypothetical protein
LTRASIASSIALMKSRSLLLPLILILAALAWRAAKMGLAVPDLLLNFSPWMALAFTGSIVLPKRMPWFVIPTLLIACDACLRPGDMSGMWLVYACLAGAAWVGGQQRGKASILRILGGTVACSVGFYLITSTQAWAMSPVYAKSLAGWLQAMTVGDPAWQPQAWVFGLRSLISDVSFSAVLILAFNAEASFRGARSPAPRLAWAA